MEFLPYEKSQKIFVSAAEVSCAFGSWVFRWQILLSLPSSFFPLCSCQISFWFSHETSFDLTCCSWLVHSMELSGKSAAVQSLQATDWNGENLKPFLCVVLLGKYTWLSFVSLFEASFLCFLFLWKVTFNSN